MASLLAHATCLRSSSGQRVPDPASRFQPDDVNGPSEAIDPSAYRWRESWAGREWDDVVLYELHLGAFSPQGTFAGAALKLDHLADLGVTAVEIMPVSDFKGRWNWGYDGAFPYAPDASYGRPEDFKAFVEAAHARGIAVLLDVVYNHFGPEGNFLSLYAPEFFTNRHKTPWGDAIQFDAPDSRPVRDFFIENAEYWIEEFHLDGLRFDAVHAIKDDSQPDLLDELAARLRARFPRPIHLLLENEDNDPQPLRRNGGKAHLYTAQWNDDIHHVLHVAATHEKQRLLRRLWFNGAPGKGHRRRLRLSGRDDALSKRAARRPQRRLAAGRVRFIHPKSRPDRQSRVWRTAELFGAPGGHARACKRLSARSPDTHAVHGRGMGRDISHSPFSATSVESWRRL